MNPQDTKKRILAAYDLLRETSTTREKFESLRTLIKGINSKTDTLLASLSKVYSDYKKLEQGDVIDLTLENLPQETEEDKKRKKILLLFIRNWRQLKSEIERIKSELEANQQGKSSQATNFANIVARAKGPFGLITIAAIVIVGISFLISSQKQKPELRPIPSPTVGASVAKQKIKVIDVGGKKIPLEELRTGAGPECLTLGRQALHYHALNGEKVKATDGTILNDPGGCGFGKVGETKVEEFVI